MVDVPVSVSVPVERNAEIAAPLMSVSDVMVEGVSVTFAKVQLVMEVVVASMRCRSGDVMMRLADVALIVTLVSASCPLLTLNTGHSMMFPVVESSVNVIVLNKTFSPATVMMADASVIFDTVFSAESVPVMERSV